MALNAAQFLDHNVEEFLIKDLEAMMPTRVCYPIVTTACAGIELLGSLFSNEFNPLAGAGYFRRYWTQYLYASRDHNREMGDALYTLVRNGLSHMFLPAEQIGVTGAQPHAHLTRDSNGRIIIDAHQLAKDFIRSYRYEFKPLIAGNATFGAQLQRILDYGNDAASQLNLTRAFPRMVVPSASTVSATTAVSMMYRLPDDISGGVSGPR